MPGNMIMLEAPLAEIRDGENTREKMDKITNYLYMLVEQMRYTLGNLGADNFNVSELAAIGETITRPLTVQLQDVMGNASAFKVTLDSISGTLQDMDGRQSKIEQTIDGLSITTKDENGKNTTFISGDSIKSGTIEGSVLTCTLQSGNSKIEGQIKFYYQNGTSLQEAGEININDEGKGTNSETKHRLFIASKGSFGLKLQSQMDSSYESKEGEIFIKAAGRVQISSGDGTRILAPNGNHYIFLNDGIYFAGEKICSV